MLRVLLVLILLSFNFLSFANNEFDTFNRSLKLGEVNLNVTTPHQEAKAHFLLGLKFLHSFMYELAREQFQLAQKHDKGFVMAYWGEAMTYKQSIWNKESLEEAQAVLARMPSQKEELTPIEKRLIQASKALFKQDDSLKVRDKHYTDMLKKLHRLYPNDVDVSAFYALSLLQYAADFPESKENEAHMKEARQLLDVLIKQHPRHVGVIHYLIHAYDSPDTAISKKALPAADKALKEISSSSHITHMSAHIYRRLNRWQDFIHANQVSVKAAENLCYQWANLKKDEKALKNLEVCNADNKYHSLEWLQYGYLLTGQNKLAKKVLARTQDTALKTNRIDFKQWYYRLFARQVLMGGAYTHPIIPIEPISEEGSLYWSSYSECGAVLANGVLAIKQHKPMQLSLSKKRLEKLITLSQPLHVPFITKTCEMHLAGLNAYDAWAKKNKVKAKHYLKRMYAIEKSNPSTEVTPSLVFIKGVELEKMIKD